MTASNVPSDQLRLDLLVTCAAPEFPVLLAQLVRERIARGLERPDVLLSARADGRIVQVQSWSPGTPALRCRLPLSA